MSTLPTEIRHPEAVNDVGGLQLELDILSDRYADFVRALHARSYAGIGDPPPPLFADNLDSARRCCPCTDVGLHQPQVIAKKDRQRQRRKDNTSTNNRGMTCQPQASTGAAPNGQPHRQANDQRMAAPPAISNQPSCAISAARGPRGVKIDCNSWQPESTRAIGKTRSAGCFMADANELTAGR